MFTQPRWWEIGRMSEPQWKESGEWIKEGLNLKGWTQEQLEDASGIDQTSISKYLKGRIRPSRETVKALAKALYGEDSLDALNRGLIAAKHWPEGPLGVFRSESGETWVLDRSLIVPGDYVMDEQKARILEALGLISQKVDGDAGELRH